MAKHVPLVSRELLGETMPADKQREFARLLEGLARLLVEHANEQEPKESATLADRIATTGRDLLNVANEVEAETFTNRDFQEVAGMLRAFAEVLELYGDKLGGPPTPPDPPEPPKP
ncbi:hypothetical protein [Amycolatopsis sp. NPDC051102]|uniref:hypothetical protein n=1 Tax=Amycolatopsis sp. NPDC051102 TaxID=3155163 RepID=UPI0034314081